MRSNNEDFSLIIPTSAFAPKNRPDNLLLLDTSVVITGASPISSKLISSKASSSCHVSCSRNCSKSPIRAIHQAHAGTARSGNAQPHPAQSRNEVKIHDGDFPDETGVDAKLVRLARNLRAKLFTNDYNLIKIAELQSVSCVNLHELAKTMRVVLLPGEALNLRIAREAGTRAKAWATSGRHDVVRQQRANHGRPAGGCAGAKARCKPGRA